MREIGKEGQRRKRRTGREVFKRWFYEKSSEGWDKIGKVRLTSQKVALELPLQVVSCIHCTQTPLAHLSEWNCFGDKGNLWSMLMSDYLSNIKEGKTRPSFDLNVGCWEPASNVHHFDLTGTNGFNLKIYILSLSVVENCFNQSIDLGYKVHQHFTPVNELLERHPLDFA